MHVCTCVNGLIQRSIEQTRSHRPRKVPVLCSEFDDCPSAGDRGVRFAAVDLVTPAGSRLWKAPSHAGTLVPAEDRPLDGRRILRWTGIAAAMAVAGVLGAVAAGRAPGPPGRAPGNPALVVAMSEEDGPPAPPGSGARALRAPDPLEVRSGPTLDPARRPEAVAERAHEPGERRLRSGHGVRSRGSEDEVAPVAVPSGPDVLAVSEGLARLNAAAPPTPSPPGVNRVAAAPAAPTGAGLAEQLQAAAAPGRAAAGAAPDPSVIGMLRAAAAPEATPPVAPAAAALPPLLTDAMVARWLPGIRAQARACVERFGVARQLTQVRVRVTGPTGAVASVEAVGALAGTATGTCIENAVRRSRLPRFAAAEKVVTVPVVTP